MKYIPGTILANSASPDLLEKGGDVKSYEIMREDVPEWWRLSFASGQTLDLSLHSRAYEQLLDCARADSALVEKVGKDALVGGYVAPGVSDSFGYGSAIKISGTGGDWVSLMIPMPAQVLEPNGICSTEESLRKGWEISASLKVVTMALSRMSQGVDSLGLQLIHVTGLVARRSSAGNSCDMGIMFARRLVRWLLAQAEEDLDALIRPKMEEACRLQEPTRELSRRDLEQIGIQFHAPPRIHFEGPGDRCGLYTGLRFSPDLDRGYELSTHNCDTPTQQLTLLAGVAALCDAARG